MNNNQKTQNSLSALLTLSERMQDEFEQCISFVKAFGEDENAVCDGFLANKEATPGTPFCKKDSKKLLEEFREYCIKSIESNRTKNAAPQDADSEYKAQAPSNGRYSQTEAIRCNTLKAPFARKPLFSEVFAEEDVNLSELPEEMKKRIKSVTAIHHYKDIFNAKGRNFLEDKYSGGVILANNKDRLFYAGAPFCQSFGNEHFYYTSCVKNCIYDCKYCYLRGMYPCGFITVFVNLDDYFKELEDILKEHSVYLCVSYDTDLLALEPLLGYCRRWIEFAGKHSNLKIEIRTKSGNAEALMKLSDISTDNVIFAWTLSPVEIAACAETNVPSIEQRFNAVSAAKKSGYPVRLCFDPMIFHAGWRESYKKLFEKVFTELNPEDILDISVGVFRISNNYLRKMRNLSTDIITAFPYVTEEGACHYGNLSKEMQDFAKKELAKYYSAEKIYSWE